MGGLFPDLPKPMIPVCGRPLLQWQIESLAAQGIVDMTLIVGHKAEAIQRHFGDGRRFGAKIGYIAEGEPLGTGGALAMLPQEETLVLFGDVYCAVDFKRFAAFHRGKRAGITLFAHPNSHPQDSDIIVADDGGKAIGWRSKKDARRGELRNLANAGLYVFDGKALPAGEIRKRDLEQDLIVPRLAGGKVYAYRSAEYVKDMGTPGRLAAVERDIENGIAAARSMQRRQRAVFIDRDGTLNEEKGFVTAPGQLRLIPGAAEAVRMLNASRYLAICVTNQPVIARGDVSFDQLDAIHARLDALLGSEGAYLDDLLFCPHHPDKGYEGEVAEYKTDCGCRKPKPGLLIEAARRYNIDLEGSYMIGDRTADIAAGQAAGCRAIGVRTGAALSDGKCGATADAVCKDLLEAVKSILENEK
jgi:D,D-heptose 1,7-bisphosphate phosphatase